ncbi:hypothetical protein SISNIDRAFT_460350 [Sistotremastrum niveocremeum HHB9708]|uniref:Uncharacterized protein n=1 Tax=Sistotremastrum niveocremeum HHB9708 TaxID=1314777 RepID=A0A164NPJ6_9AGAM|nr:hypothetical protein SISNIDRAFT_460350 [Sistotremastrum niveocremeum HHB9708]
MSLFNQKHPYAQGKGTAAPAQGDEMHTEGLLTGPLPEISFGPCHQDSGQIDASLHDHFSIGAIYPPPIISIGREDPEALGSHVIKRNTIHQPPHEPIEEKILSSGSSATHKSNKTLPDIHAAEPGDASLFFPGYFADCFAEFNGRPSSAYSVVPEVKEEPRARVSAESLSEEPITERTNQFGLNINIETGQEGGPETHCCSVGGSRNTWSRPAGSGPSFNSLQNAKVDTLAQYSQLHRTREAQSGPSTSTMKLSALRQQQPTASVAGPGYRESFNISGPWVPKYGHDPQFKDLWTALLTARANELYMPPGELIMAVTRFLGAKNLPELQGFDSVLSVDRRKQLLGLCNLYPKEHAGSGGPPDMRLDGTDGEKGLCFAALASLRSKLTPTSWVDINVRLVQVSRQYLRRALRKYFAAKLWDPELALGLVILGTVFAVRNHWQDDQTRHELSVIIRWSLQMSYEQCTRARAAGTRPQDLYIFYHVNFAAVILDTYLGQEHRTLRVNPDHLTAHQKALSDAHRDISPMELIGRGAELLFLVRRVEASLHHNYWRQSETWEADSTTNFNSGIAKVKPIAEAFRVQLANPDF